MNRAKEEFKKRKREIEKYFDFLSKLDNDLPQLNFSNMGKALSYKVDEELLRILKANGFLLIYNLVEAVTKISLIEYLNSIEKSKTSFKNLEKEIQELWIENQLFADKKRGQKNNQTSFMEVYNEIVTKTIINFTKEIKDNKGEVVKEFVKLSGNIDARVIKELGTKYGFDAKLDDAGEKAGASLVEIKRKRNFLAHGRMTFVECGKEYSVQQMCTYKTNAITYLDAILNLIESHIKNKKFKRSKVAMAATIA